MDSRRREQATFITIFSTAFALRLMPELWALSYPVGYDIPIYAIKAIHFLEDDPLCMLAHPPLVFAILWGFHLLGLDIFMVLKIFSPFLYGLMMVSFYIFLRKGLGWDMNKSLFCALLCAFQPTAMRMSWDLLKMELGLTALLFFMANFDAWRLDGKWPLISASAVVIALAHQIPGILMFIFIAYKWWEERTLKQATMLFLQISPAISIFAIQLMIFTGIIKPGPYISFREVIWLECSYGGMPVIGVPFLRDYLLERPFRSGGWVSVALYVPLMFLACFSLLLPFAIFGFKRYGFLDALFAWLVFASFSVIAYPRAYPFAHFFRWILIMVFPMSIYAAEGALKLARRAGGRRALAVVLLLNAAVGVGYANGLPYSSAGIPSPMMAYMPNRMTYSTIELDQIDDCRACITWLNAHAGNGSVLVVEQRFFAWALMWLDERMPIAVYRADTPLNDVELGGVLSAYEHVYTIWYVGQAPSWRGHTSLEVFRSGDIAVYEFSGGQGA